MVLRPILDPEPPFTGDFVHPWAAIECRQRAQAATWWLITQPNHAILSGDIARHFSREFFPFVDPQIVSAIAMHDAGWTLFEHDIHQKPRVHADGRPVAFFEIEPQSFLRAWTASIDRVQEDTPAGAYMVSQHFDWLGRYRLEKAADPDEVKQQLRDFLLQEQDRRKELVKQNHRAHWDGLLPVLQFCDLLSLYLCSGTRQPVEFLLDIAGEHIRARYEGDVCVLSPTLFPDTWNATVDATQYPPKSDNAAGRLSIALR